MIEIEWQDANQTILVWKFHDGWKTQDFMKAISLTEKTVSERTHRSIVHILLDVQRTQTIPSDMLTLGRNAIKRAISNGHKGLVVIINPSQIWLELYNALQSTMEQSINIRFAKNADEAYQMMNDANDSSINT